MPVGEHSETPWHPHRGKQLYRDLDCDRDRENLLSESFLIHKACWVTTSTHGTLRLVRVTVAVTIMCHGGVSSSDALQLHAAP